MLLQELDGGLPLGSGSVEIGPLRILRLEQRAAVETVRSAVLLRRKIDIAICNAHTILTAIDDPSYSAMLNSMVLLNDGAGANLASRYLQGCWFPDNLNGTDFVPALLAGIGIPLRIFLLGAQEDRLQGARAHIERHFPDHAVVGARNGYFDDCEIPEICAQVSAAQPDLLLVAMGNPRQERFIHENRSRLNANVTIGVGALFDFMSGSVVRAPKPVRAIGLEWLFRLLQEPNRLSKRYIIGIPRFLAALHRLKRAQRFGPGLG